MASDNNRKDKAAENVEGKNSTSSGRKTKQTKNPKSTTRRKATNYFQPNVHGLLLRKIGYDANGRPIPEIHRLFNSLIERFGSDDVLILLTAEMAVADYARLAKGLKSEARYELLEDCYTQILSAITRHVNSSRRNLDNSVKLLRELEAESLEEEDSAEAPLTEERERPMSEDESPYPRLTKDDLFSEEEWSSMSGDTPSEEASGPSASVAASSTEQTPAAETAACAQENDPASEGQTNTPTAHPPVAAVTMPGDAASAETAASQPADGAAPASGASAQPKSPKAA